MWRMQFDKGKSTGEKPDGCIENPDQAREVEKEERTAGTGKTGEELFAEAVELHRRGIQGDKEAVAKAYELLVKVKELLPDNNLVEAYYGSTVTLLGRDAVDPIERFKKAVRGLKILDGAVSRDPENIEVRILRGNVCYRLPETYFHRTATAVEDFSYLVSRYEQDPSLFSQDYYFQLLYDLGAAYKNLGRNQEADSAWQKLLSAAGETKYRELLSREGVQGVQSPGIIPDSGGDMEAPVLSGKKKGEVLEEGVKLYELALTGDKDATQKAFAFFAKAIQADPGDLLLKAYYADCMSLKGRDAADPTEMFANAIKAMQLFDEIVNRNPDNWKIRLMRARHSFRLPEGFFHRTASAIADFDYLIRCYENDHSSFPEETYWQILYDQSMAYRRLGLENEAAAVVEKLLSLDPPPKFKALIEKEKNDVDVSPRLNLLAADQKEALLAEGIRLHDLAVAGSRKAAKLALELLKKAHEADPRDPLAQGYYGSCLALNARDSMDTNVLFGDTIKGLKLLNRAISRDWNNPKLRLLRAYLTYSLPEAFFHLTQRALKDFRYLKTAYERDNSLFSRELYHQILYDMGVAYERTGETARAKKVWSKLLQESPDPKYQALLEGKGVDRK
ncbi:MAG TPA: tetratricopeptide repeat protein [Syntrophomonadaceae bacterium]|nr:tetratricopeptide repeat protein [Syntrophomonadaceae bacterium]